MFARAIAQASAAAEAERDALAAKCKILEESLRQAALDLGNCAAMAKMGTPMPVEIIERMYQQARAALTPRTDGGGAKARPLPDNFDENHGERICMCNVTPCPCDCHSAAGRHIVASPPTPDGEGGAGK